MKIDELKREVLRQAFLAVYIASIRQFAAEGRRRRKRFRIQDNMDLEYSTVGGSDLRGGSPFRTKGNATNVLVRAGDQELQLGTVYNLSTTACTMLLNEGASRAESILCKSLMSDRSMRKVSYCLERWHDGLFDPEVYRYINETARRMFLSNEIARAIILAVVRA